MGMRLILFLFLVETSAHGATMGLANSFFTASALKPASSDTLWNGLQHYWRFEEASGTTREDAISAAPANFTDGGMTWNQQVGKNGNCATNTAGNAMDSAAFSMGSGDWTLSFWFCHTYIVDSPLLLRRDAYFYCQYNGASVAFDIGGTALTGGSATSGVWNSVVVTYVSGGTTTLYVNGTSVDTDSTTFTDDSVGITIEDIVNALSFAIDEMGIWDRALSAGEVTSLQTRFY